MTGGRPRKVVVPTGSTLGQVMEGLGFGATGLPYRVRDGAFSTAPTDGSKPRKLSGSDLMLVENFK